MRRFFESFTEATQLSTEDWGLDYRIPEPTTEEANTWWNNIKFREDIPYKDSVAPVVPDLGGFTMPGVFYPYSTQKRKCFDCGNEYPAHYEFEWHCQTCRTNYLSLRHKAWERLQKDRLAKMREQERASKPQKPFQLELFAKS
ncbi:MAG: hypothetical protein WCJ95_09550 [Mariniphaga sp.]